MPDAAADTSTTFPGSTMPPCAVIASCIARVFRVPMAESLSELLLRIGLVASDGLATARAEAARTGKHLAECIIDLGLVEERRLAEWIARASDLSVVDPIPEDAAAAVQHHIPAAIARQLNVVPLRMSGGQLFVVMVNPLEGDAIDMLKAVTTRTIYPTIGVRSEIARLVTLLYPDEPAPAEEAPFDFSDQTLMRARPDLSFLRDLDAGGMGDPMATISPRTVAIAGYMHQSAPSEPDEEFGTMIARPADGDRGTLPAILPPAPVQARGEARGGEDATAPTNPIVGIERRLDQIVTMIRTIEKRLDRIESLFQDQGALDR